MTLRLSYKLSWPESRMVVNKSADWGEEGEINISPDNIEVREWFIFAVEILMCKKMRISNKIVGVELCCTFTYHCWNLWTVRIYDSVSSVLSRIILVEKEKEKGGWWCLISCSRYSVIEVGAGESWWDGIRISSCMQERSSRYREK